jgi:hypothetical protein
MEVKERCYARDRERGDRAAALRAAGFAAGAALAFRGADFVGFGAAFDAEAGLAEAGFVAGVDDVTGAVGADSGGRVSCRTASAAPPTTSTTGHSTSPAAPSAASVSAAAGVERLPLLTPLRIPSTVPRTPPTTPLTTAPDSAPAAAVVALTILVAPCTVASTTPMVDSLHWPWHPVNPGRFTSSLPSIHRRYANNGRPSISPGR